MTTYGLKLSRESNNRIKSGTTNNNHNTCDKTRGRCDKIYAHLSQTEEDCNSYRSYLSCLQKLNKHCDGDIRYWLMVSTAEKLILERCSSDESGIIKPLSKSKKNLYSYKKSSDSHNIKSDINSGYINNNNNNVYHTKSCVVSVHSNSESEQYSNNHDVCAIYGSLPHIINFKQVRQPCKLIGAWPLIHNRFLTVQITSKSISGYSEPVIDMVSITIKPDKKCIYGIGTASSNLPYLIYMATGSEPLPSTLLSSQTEFEFGDLVSLIRSSFNDGSNDESIEIKLNHLGPSAKITIIRNTESASLAIVVSLPTQISNTVPYSFQQQKVFEICSKGCPTTHLLSEPSLSTIPDSKINNIINYCLSHGLRGHILDSCFYYQQLNNRNITITPQYLHNIQFILSKYSNSIMSSHTRPRPFILTNSSSNKHLFNTKSQSNILINYYFFLLYISLYLYTYHCTIFLSFY